jgi:dipeptidyl aminopeptidase/acylaminoacyl peptidase
MRTCLTLLLTALIVAPAYPAVTQKPLKLNDVLGWKRIQTPIVSNNGEWFAYKLVPNDGNSDIVLTHLTDGKEQRFSIGQIVRPNPYLRGGEQPEGLGGRPHDIAFSDDSKWIAFNVHPLEKEMAVLRKTHKPVEDKVVLVEISTQTKTEFERVKRFSFSGEKSSAIALHRYGAAAAAPAAAEATPGPAKPDDKPQGSDLIVMDLASGTQLSVGNVSDFAFNKSGEWLAWLVDAQDKLGNGIELRNMANGSVIALDTQKALYKQLSWTEKGDGLAVLRGTEDKHWEDKLYSVVAFKDFRDTAAPKKFSFDPAKDAGFPEKMTISADRRPMWMADLSEVTFGIRELKPKEPKAEGPDAKKAEATEDKPDLVIWNWKDPRLQSMQQVQEQKDKNFSYLCAWQPDGKFMRLSDEAVREVALSPEGKFGIGSDVREYELEANLDGKRFEDVYRVDPKTGDRKLVLTKARWVFGTSPDGTHLLHYADGAFLSADLATGESHNLTKGVPSVFINTEDDHNVVKPPTRSLGWSKDSKFIFISDNWDIWKIPADGGTAVNLTGNGKKNQIRYQAIWQLDPDDKGFDLSKPLYIRAYGEWTKKGGIARVDPDKPGVTMLHWDDASYASLVKAKDADVYLYSRETPQQSGDFYLAKSDLADGKKMTDANPQQKDCLWTKGPKLVEYLGPKGNKLQGVLYLPADYEPGKKYPTIVYMYEKLSQNANTYPAPGVNGFSVGFYTSNGYAVLTPDITYKVNDPGVTSIFCILAALKAAEATGIVDAAHVGLHGHSWGGYQTAFAVTQTTAFRAAIAGAPLTDMISMYSSIYWNSGSTNQPIFESSQGRFSGGYLQETEAYIRNSPVYHASQVQTPLLILHNDKDGAVDHTQGIEYFNTLRRLGKPVVMLEYKGENHGLFKIENMKDYTVRMKEFWDYYLMDKPAPKWWTEGVPLLKMSDELKAREATMKEQSAPPAAVHTETGTH